MDQSQHQRRVGVGADERPFGARLLRLVAAQRADQDEFGAPLARRAHAAALCRLIPPLATALFFSAMPPKERMISLSPAIASR